MQAKDKPGDAKTHQSVVPKKPSKAGKCLICSKPAKVRYCSHECRLIAKVQRTRARRPLKDHACVCRRCGKVFRLGRPRRLIPKTKAVE